MAKRGRAIPSELKHDAIVEALLEIRFDMRKETIPEILFGRLAEHGPWKGFEQRPLPAYQVPPPLRQADPNLRFQPVFELAAPDKRRTIRIGPHVLSYHRLRPYVGWEKFKPELGEAIDGLFSTTEGLSIRRLGFRYINALQTDVHGIRSILDLDLKLSIAEESVSSNVNINFTTDISNDTNCTVRIATSEFVQGELPPNTSVFVDVDVFTKEAFRTEDQIEVKKWVEFAHTKEKEQFFRLLTDQTIDSLKKEG
ncbi:MAG: TIGR04255 family protein [Syntrophobacteraceae bacterium]|jgi:uncharacterized protein (TIGR04255 family)